MTNANQINFKDNESFTSLLDIVYPIGAMYWSFDSTSPANLFGGSWVQIKDCFMRPDESSGVTAGSDAVTLTTNQIPSHTHSASSNSAGFHTHNHGAWTSKYRVGFLGAYDSNGKAFDLYSYFRDYQTSGEIKSPGWNANKFPNVKSVMTETVSSNGDHSHTITVNNTGGGSFSQQYAILYNLLLLEKICITSLEVM